MLKKQWKINNGDQKTISHLQSALKIHPILCSLLSTRGITTYEEAERFFRPSTEQLHDPFLMAGMHEAIERIDHGIEQNEKILVYGDYDVDGTTSVAIVYSFFRSLYPNIDFYIPDRDKEGYGISDQSIEWASKNKFSLIIALDCGIKANNKVKHAKGKGIDYIICDHHQPGKNLPEAVAILDPKRSDCKYPFKELSGCGIGFKLLQAYGQRNELPFEKAMEYLDLVAISIASDIVPIVDENRVLAFLGLKKLNSSPSKGVKALIEVSNLKKEIIISDIVFGLGPRINAVGRMGDANKAVKLLVADDETLANIKADTLQVANTERKKVDLEVTNEALTMLKNDPLRNTDKSTVLYQPYWHKGVIGIVASRLIEKYYRPTIIFTKSNGMITGSARSVSGYNIYEAIQKCESLLEHFGGHQYAAGITMKPENIEKFKVKFNKIVGDTIDDDLLIPKIEINAELSLSDITQSFYNIVQQMEPFGPGNMRPVFISKDVHDFGQSRIVKEDHLKLSVKQNNAHSQNGIAFNMAEYYDQITDGQLFDICYVLEENEWNGNKSIQLNIKDIKQ